MTLKITGLSSLDSLKINLYVCARLPCQTDFPASHLKFLCFLLSPPRQVLSWAWTLPFRSASYSRGAVGSPENPILSSHLYGLPALHHHRRRTDSLCFLSRYLNGSSSSGPSAIPPAATCKASTTWSRRSSSSTSSSTLVSASCSALSVTGRRCDSLPFVLMQELLLIEPFHTRRGFRAGGS